MIHHCFPCKLLVNKSLQLLLHGFYIQFSTPIFVLKFGDEDGFELFPISNIHHSVDLDFSSQDFYPSFSSNEANLFLQRNQNVFISSLILAFVQKDLWKTRVFENHKWKILTIHSLAKEEKKIQVNLSTSKIYVS